MSALLPLLAVVAAAIIVAALVRDLRHMRTYRRERRAADTLACRAADLLLLGDVEEATRLARVSRDHEARALDALLARP